MNQHQRMYQLMKETNKTKLSRMCAAPTLLPAHMVEGITNYIDYGVRPGSFLYNVLINNFVEAYRRGDDANQSALSNWAAFLVHFCPEDSYGSVAKVEAWIAQGGTDGDARG